jgi:hypothetical protein
MQADITVELLENLPDGSYKTGDIYPLHFIKKNGFIEMNDGTLKTYEEFVEFCNSPLNED